MRFSRDNNCIYRDSRILAGDYNTRPRSVLSHHTPSIRNSVLETATWSPIATYQSSSLPKVQRKRKTSPAHPSKPPPLPHGQAVSTSRSLSLIALPNSGGGRRSSRSILAPLLFCIPSYSLEQAQRRRRGLWLPFPLAASTTAGTSGPAARHIAGALVATPPVLGLMPGNDRRRCRPRWRGGWVAFAATCGTGATRATSFPASALASAPAAAIVSVAAGTTVAMAAADRGLRRRRPRGFLVLCRGGGGGGGGCVS